MSVFSALNEFCLREYESEFDTNSIGDAQDIQFVFTSMIDTETGKEVDAAVSVNLVDSSIVYRVNGNIVHTEKYSNGEEIAEIIKWESFDSLCGWLDTYSSDRYEL